MTDTSTDNLTNISKILWNNVLKPDNSWKDNSKCNKIYQKILHFNPNHPNTIEHIDKVIKCVTRGVRLTEEAINWYEPAIADTPKRGEIDKIRGVQWRLVIAYSGFEITTKALMNNFERGKPLDIPNFIKMCSLPSYNPLDTPNPKRKDNLDKWLAKDQNAIAEFLSVTAGDKKIIERWIIKANSISSWEDAVKLAKALRNASAHGFLSAKKVQDWQLKPGLSILADNLGEIMAAGLKQLI
ncbi:MAG: hypothetical protein ACKO3K_00795 [Cuspidothrix sp.]